MASMVRIVFKGRPLQNGRDENKKPENLCFVNSAVNGFLTLNAVQQSLDEVRLIKLISSGFLKYFFCKL